MREGDESELKSEEEDEEAEAAGARTFAAESSSPSSPPKNALLLTRCKSAPYRSSSLACRFWGSPIIGAGEAQRPGGEAAGAEPEHMLVSEKEARVHPAEEDDEAAADEEKARFLNEKVTVIVAEKMMTKSGELKMREEEGLRPPARLTRSKSEPARTTALKAGCR